MSKHQKENRQSAQKNISAEKDFFLQSTCIVTLYMYMYMHKKVVLGYIFDSKAVVYASIVYLCSGSCCCCCC